MPSNIVDSLFLRDLYGTPEMRAVFDDRNLLQKWLDFESALAQAEAGLGLIPAEAAEAISRCGKAENLNIERIKELVDETVHPIVPLIRVLQESCPEEAGEFIHWGATTQDVMDTALVLQLKEAVLIFENRLETLVETLSMLARRHRDTFMAGRTHGQQGPPITFGYKAAVWLAEFYRHRQRIQQVKPRLLVGQFGGAVGSLASVAEHGFAIQERMMAILELDVPLVTWHTARDGFAEFTGLLGNIAASLGKIAREVIALQRTELGEVEEPFMPGKVGSSTMPHKRNPMECEAVLALARLVIRNVPLSFDAVMQEHERDWSADHIEWAYLPEVCIMTDGALKLTNHVLSGLKVDEEKMLANIQISGGLLLSEAVMLALARYVGRQTAHEMVYECAMRSVEDKRPFRETLLEHFRISQIFSPDEIDRLLEPSGYSGLAGEFVDRVLAAGTPSSLVDPVPT